MCCYWCEADNDQTLLFLDNSLLDTNRKNRKFVGAVMEGECRKIGGRKWTKGEVGIMIAGIETRREGEGGGRVKEEG